MGKKVASYIVLGVNAVISGIVAYGARSNDVPLYYALMLGAAVFLAIALGAYLINLIALSRRPNVEPSAISTDESSTNQKTIDSLKAAHEQAVEKLKVHISELERENEQSLRLTHTMREEIRGHKLKIKDLEEEIITKNKEIEHYKEQLEPKIDILFIREPPYRIYSQIEGEFRGRKMRMMPNMRGEVNIEVKFLNNVVINNLRVEVEDVKYTSKPEEKLPLPPVIPLRRMDDAPEGRVFFSLIRTATNERRITLCSENLETEPILRYEDISLVLVARGSNTTDRRKRVSIKVDEMGGGIPGLPGVSLLPY